MDKDYKHGLYISPPFRGLVYVAHRTAKGSKSYVWSMLPVVPTGRIRQIDTAEVPEAARKSAYHWLNRRTPNVV